MRAKAATTVPEGESLPAPWTFWTNGSSIKAMEGKQSQSTHKQAMFDAHKQRDDEFYTLFADIAGELPKYHSFKKQFEGKRIICPCDWDASFDEIFVYKEEGYVPPQGSMFENGGTIKEIDIEKSRQKIEKDINLVKCNFVRFLVAHAEDYGIKSVSASGYDPAAGRGVKFQDIDYSHYDMVITNPPFSLFREFIDIMFKNNNEFLIIGPLTAITYTDIFQHIQKNELWLGYAKQLSGFELADGTKLLAKNPEGSTARACKWYTNLDVSYRHDRMILTEKYSPSKHPKYYNYDGIDISKTVDIPYDFEGHMGVPVSFLAKHNPEQFEIITKGVQAEKTVRWKGDKSTLWIEKDGKPWKAPFERIIIRNKQAEKI
ncbi:MAG: adenine-specific methyltransferase EcoRI family protein [Spirochaetaceae bacterium]|nr:adenine-specific methyltransferase EcoRI family protein [Spirochaetaceae bacterium]